MKLLVTGRLYPYFIRGAMKKQLEEHFDRVYARKVLREANRGYLKVVKRAPEIGGKANLLIDNFYISAYVVALYKILQETVNLEEFDEIVARAFENFTFIKKVMEKEDLMSSAYRIEMQNISKWCEKNKDEYPTNWLLTMEEKEKGEVHMTYHNCPLCDLCVSEGVPQLIKTICNIDYILLNFARGNIEMLETLGNGDLCCDFVITKS